MDALRYILAREDKAKGIDGAKAARMALADALRDLSDEIESGDRSILGVQTYEHVITGELPVSILHLTTRTERMPK
jgi:hypothetical protein